MKYLLPLIILLFAVSNNAETFTVTRNDDRNTGCNNGDCSLREAITAAALFPSDDIIEFSPTVTLIQLQRAGFVIGNRNGGLTIKGTGADKLTIRGRGVSDERIFSTADAILTISGVTLTNATLAMNVQGGAINATGGSLTLDGVHITGNSAGFGGGVFLGSGTHLIINSAFTNNNATNCGALSVRTGTTTIINSTFSGNSASGNGGGICNDGSTVLDSRLNLRNVTITNNTAAAGGGLYQSGITTIGNTIIAGNSATGSPTSDIKYETGQTTTSFTSEGGNLIGNSSNTGIPIVYQSSDIKNVNLLLGQLQNNGGQTPTHALLPGSPAIDKGLNSLVIEPFDQRGEGFTRIFGGTVDIGAYELQSVVSNADADNDGILDNADNCPNLANPEQLDTDGDFLGDVCDPDDDNDTVQDNADNCQFVINTDQLDFDRDFIGDACDLQTGPVTLREQCSSYRRFDFPRPFKNERDCLSALTAPRLRFLGWEKNL